MRLELGSFAILHKHWNLLSAASLKRLSCILINPLSVICNWKFSSNFKNGWFIYDALKPQILLKTYSHEIKSLFATALLTFLTQNFYL